MLQDSHHLPGALRSLGKGEGIKIYHSKKKKNHHHLEKLFWQQFDIAKICMGKF